MGSILAGRPAPVVAFLSVGVATPGSRLTTGDGR